MSAEQDFVISSFPTNKFLTAYKNNRYEAAMRDTYYSGNEYGNRPRAEPPDESPQYSAYQYPQEGEHAISPMWKQWMPSKPVTFRVDLAFDKPSGASADMPIEVNVSANDILRAIGAERSLEDMSKAIVREIKILGTTLPKKAPCYLYINDKNRTALINDNIVGKRSSNSICKNRFGHPMYNCGGGKTVIYKDDRPISEDLMRFGHAHIGQMKKGVRHLEYPSKFGEEPKSYAFIPKHPNGAYFVWALELDHPVYTGLLTDPIHQDPHNEDYFQLETPTFHAVVKAYEKKLAEDIKFHDLSNITASLHPLKSNAFAEMDSSEHITLEMSCYFSSNDNQEDVEQLAFPPSSHQAAEIRDYSQLVERY